MRRLIYVILLLAALPQAGSSDELVTCKGDREAIAQSWPKYPSPDEAADYFGNSTTYLHVLVEGTVIVSFTVLPSGDVESVKVIDSTYSLVGRDRENYEDGYFDNFHPSNVTRTVKLWKFEPMGHSCQMTRAFTFKFEE